MKRTTKILLAIGLATATVLTLALPAKAMRWTVGDHCNIIDCRSGWYCTSCGVIDIGSSWTYWWGF